MVFRGPRDAAEADRKGKEMSEHQDTSGNDDQAPVTVPHTAAEWLAALDAGRVDSTWAAEDQGEQYFPGYWQVDCEIGFTIDGYEVATVPCWVECGGEGGAWRVGDGDTGGDDCGRPQIVSESSIDGSWSVVHSGRNNMSCDFSIPAADEDEAEELARTLDDLAQEAYNAIWLRPSDIDDIETVTKIVWNANSPEEARELAAEAGIVGEENLLKAEGIWFRDEWKHGTDAFEELFPTYGEGSRATDPNDFLEDDFRSIVDGELSVREASDWWKDYGKRLHDVEEAIRDVGLVYDGDTDGDFETRVRQLEAWLNEHTVEPLVPFVTPPECQGQTVEYSYSLVNNRGNTFIIEREHDHGDGEIIHRLYVDGDPDGDFDPQNGAPKLGEFVGQVAVEEQTFPTPEELAAMKADRIRL